jgi:hypothetical protein
MAESVQQANDLLAELRDRACRWWLYSASHCTFEVVVGDPHAEDNLVLLLAGCNHIAGPIRWPNQRLQVVWRIYQEAGNSWVFTLEDDTVGFKAVGGVFGWRRGYDLLEYRSLYFPRS